MYQARAGHGGPLSHRPHFTAIDATGFKYDVNDFDLWAVEAGLQLKEKAGQGEVVVISLGPDQVQEQIRKALSMGADRGIRLKVAALPPDPYVVARALANELAGGGYDLILFGRIAVNASNGATGAIVAQRLGLPCVTAVSKLELTAGRGRAQRGELKARRRLRSSPSRRASPSKSGPQYARATAFALQRNHGCQEKPLEVKSVTLGESRVTVRRLGAAAGAVRWTDCWRGSRGGAGLVRLLQTEAKVL